MKIFLTQTTGTKSIDHKIKYGLYDNYMVTMTPTEYLSLCKKIPEVSHINSKLTQSEQVSWVKDAIVTGTTMPIPFISVEHRIQDGIHRMIAIGQLYGLEFKTPVLIIGKL